jgi:hypothetical protein
MHTLPPMMSQQSSLELCLATSSRVNTLVLVDDISDPDCGRGSIRLARPFKTSNRLHPPTPTKLFRRPHLSAMVGNIQIGQSEIPYGGQRFKIRRFFKPRRWWVGVVHFASTTFERAELNTPTYRQNVLSAIHMMANVYLDVL